MWSGEAHVDAGVMLMTDNKLEEAATHFLRAVEIDRNATIAYFHLGTALYHLNNPSEAAKQFHFATLVLPQHAEAYLSLGVSLREADDDDSLGELALQQLLRATELSPHHALAYSYLGTSLYAQQHTDEALGALQTCIELDPAIAVAHHNYGMILLDEHSAMNSTTDEAELLRDNAAVYFEEAVRLEPKSVDGNFRLATVHHMSGRVRDALKSYRRVLELEPGHSKTAELLPELERDTRHEDAIDKAIEHTYDEV